MDDMGTSASQTGLSQAEPEVSALRASIPSAWQPIETAPRDDSGRSYLLCSAGDRYASVGYWHPGDEGEPGLAGWWWYDEVETGPFSPTHWMPMPQPVAEGNPFA